MSFLHPEFIYYMMIPLLILFVLLLTQKESQADFFSEDVMNKLRVSANMMTLKARNALFFLMAIFMLLALAQPVLKDGVVKIKAESADIMIALDISDSMLATDVYPNRLKAAKHKAIALLDESPNERIGVIAFAKNSYLVSPLSFDSSAVSFLLSQLDTNSITEKGTDFLSVLNIVIQTQKEQEKKYLLILSDGGDKTDFSDEIDLAKENGVKVFVLAIATKKGAPIKTKEGGFIKQNGNIIISKLNGNIADLATKTGGTYIESTTSDKDIKAMFKEITNKSDERELKSEEIPRYTQLFYYPLGMALFLLLIATSSFGRKEALYPKGTTHVAVLISLVFMFKPLHVEASMLDFMEINKAKKAYEAGEYEKSAKMYEEFANKSTNGQGHYNAANAYYKQKNYTKAIENYTKATFDTDNERASNYSNLGNAYAKDSKLEKAVESYEKSLKIKDDTNTKENLEAVKKMIKKQKQDKKENKEANEKESEQNKDKSDKSDKKDGDKKDSNENQEKSSDDEKSKDEKDSSKSKDSKDKQNNKDDMKSKDEKEQKNDKSKAEKDEERKDKLEKLDDEKEKNKDKSQQQQAGEMKKQKMSEAEEQKWLKHLNQDSKTYLYRLGDTKPKKLDPSEKPW